MGSTIGTTSLLTAAVQTAANDSAKSRLNDPSIEPLLNRPGVTYQKPSNFTLYPQGEPKASDVDQGSKYGDCYLMSSLADMAQQDPQRIKNMIRDNKNGTYSVSMYSPMGQKVDVTVNSKLPVSGGELDGNSGSTGPKQANWASIMEKAFAKYNGEYHTVSESGGYNGIIHGGQPGDAFAAFTGQDGKHYSPQGDTDALGQRMQSDLSNGKLLTANTTKTTALPGGVTVEPNHAYSILAVNKSPNGQWYADVRNPWGAQLHANPKQDGETQSDGVIRMPLSDFQKSFSSVSTSDQSVGAGKDSYTGSTTSVPENASLIDTFNQVAAKAGAGSFTSNITAGWKHIEADMSADNTSHMQQDLQWMLDHISSPGNYDSKEQAVVDATNSIAKAYGLTLEQPKAPTPTPGEYPPI